MLSCGYLHWRATPAEFYRIAHDTFGLLVDTYLARVSRRSTLRGMAKHYKLNGVWHAEMYFYDQSTDRRVRVRRSTGIKVDGTREAEKRAKIVAGEMEKSLVQPEQRVRKTLTEALSVRERALLVRRAPSKSMAVFRSARRHVLAKLGGRTPCLALTDQKLLSFAAELLTEGLATDTVRRYVVELRTALKLAGQPVPAKPDLGSAVYRDAAVTPDEVKRICRWLSPQRQRIVQLVFQTACRQNEVYKLVRLAPGVGRFVGTTDLKTGPRTIPLTPLAERILQDGPLEPWPSAYNGLRRAGELAGLAYRVSWNALRAGAATTLLKADVAPARIAALLGHADTTMVMKRYAKLKNLKVMPDDLRALGESDASTS